ncbi:DUF3265 domain-containing protein [Photobacterium damselae]|nr:DUF3265 domain-containing protein [Photobacterium damselae]
MHNTLFKSDLQRLVTAWHFCNALRLVLKVVCGSFGIALFTP